MTSKKTQAKSALYAPPSNAALAAYVSSAALLFALGMGMGMNTRIDKQDEEIAANREEIDELKRENQMLRGEFARARDLAMRPTAVAPVTAPAQTAPIAESAGLTLDTRPLDIPAGKPRSLAQIDRVAAEAEEMLSAMRGPVQPPEQIESQPVVQQPAPAAVTPPTPLPTELDGPELPETASNELPDQLPVADSSEPAAALDVPPPPASAENATGPRGMVLATNPDHRRVMLSIGAANGVEEGQRFSIFRDNVWVGDVRVQKVFEYSATCNIETPTTRGIRRHDQARAAGETN